MKNGLLKLTVVILLNLFLLPHNCLATDYTADSDCDVAWLFESSNDPTPDASGNGITGSITGDPTHSSASSPAAYSTSYYSFDETNDYIKSDSDTGTDANEMSVVLWVKVNSSDGDWNSAWGLDPTSGQIGIWTNGDANHGLYLYENGTGGFNGMTGISNVDDTWVHVAVTFSENNDRCNLYKDGSSVDSDTHSTTDTLGDKMIVGSALGGETTRDIYADIDEVAQFSRELSSTEVNDIMDNGLEGAVAAAGQVMKLRLF